MVGVVGEVAPLMRREYIWGFCTDEFETTFMSNLPNLPESGEVPERSGGEGVVLMVVGNEEKGKHIT